MAEQQVYVTVPIRMHPDDVAYLERMAKEAKTKRGTLCRSLLEAIIEDDRVAQGDGKA